MGRRLSGLAIIGALALGSAAAARPIAVGDDLHLVEPAIDLHAEPLTRCFDGERCGEDGSASIGDARVSVVHIDSGSDGNTFAQVDVGGTVRYFLIRDLTLAVGHMSADRFRERRDGAVITAGTLAGGGAAAVIRLDWSSQHYVEGRGPDGLEEKSRDPWQRHASVMVCALTAAPSCAPAVSGDCARGGCRATLAAGTLIIATRSGRERHAVAP
ncbi:MAG: hypothetical protein K8W52_03075 [Deltaproteobacteria bacterium]|nr:hypothetical protein [Deltaproteobacteria bacterium]